MTTTFPGFPLRSSLLALALSAVAPLAWADIYLCVDANGRKELTDTKRPGCKALSVPSAIPAPAARRDGAKVPVVTPNGFPKVDNAQQKARDADRKSILESELRTESAKLKELQKEYNAGQPERQGNEKNYQKYLDRVAALKDSITRTEKNIEALNREISNIK
jgi:hypothetical protein